MKISVLGYAVIIILILTTGRYIAGNYNFSHFISAGSDFVDSGKTASPIIVSEGQGYDGQFFYRLALDPFNYSEELYGVKLDFPAYRSQRIVYPLLVWIITAGGYPPLVPFAMVLVNILAFIGIVYFFNKIVEYYNRSFKFSILVLFLFGIYLSIAKDLSEVTELFFFTGASYFMIKERWWLFTVFVSLSLLTRETSLIAVIPLCAFLIYKNKTKGAYFIAQIILPIFILGAWKYFVQIHTLNQDQFEGTGNFSLPFSGILPGLIANLDISTTIKKLQLIFWIAYFIWQLWFIQIVLSQILKVIKTGQLLTNPFTWVYLIWLAFATLLSQSIYIDDWSFVRVFSLWNMAGLLVLCSSGISPGRWFYRYSALLLIFTVIRLIIK